MTLLNGDCLAALRDIEDSSIDAVVTDPPYGLGFMGKEWDSPGGTGDFPMRRTDAANTVNTGASRQGGRQRSCEDFTKRQARDARTYQAWCEEWAAECLRVLKPGGHLLAFGGTRTYHRLAAGIEDAGFELRDAVFWLYGQGFPKSRNLCTCPDPPTPGDVDAHGWTLCVRCSGQIGLGTALKPACEPVSVGRKSPVGSVAANVTSYGTGALNIAACRIDGQPRPTGTRNPEASAGSGNSPLGSDGAKQIAYDACLPEGRWPANVVLDEATAAMLDEQTGILTSGPESDRGHRRNADSEASRNAYGGFQGQTKTGVLYGDSGGASRFFYCAKASQAERNAGLEGFEAEPFGWSGGAAAAASRGESYDNGDGGINRTTLRQNFHPTVKPVALMRWLCRLVAPPGGVVLDPFIGSGTTAIAAHLEGFQFWGIEQDADYLRIAEARIAFWKEHGDEALEIVRVREKFERQLTPGQLDLLGEVA